MNHEIAPSFFITRLAVAIYVWPGMVFRMERTVSGIGVLLSLVVAGGCAPSQPFARKERLPASLLTAARPEESFAGANSSVLRPAGAPTPSAPQGITPAGAQVALPPSGPGQVPPYGTAGMGYPPTPPPMGMTTQGLPPAQPIANAIDPRYQYASLVNHEEEGYPALPPATPAAPPSVARAPIEMAAAPRAPVTSGPEDADVAAQRIRAMARRVQESAPEKLEEFLRDVRQASAQGNWREVIASWDVVLEFQRSGQPLAPASPSGSASSLSSALASGLRQSTDAALPVAARNEAPEPTARMTAVSTLAREEASRGVEERRISYRPANEELPRRPALESNGVNFASWAEQMEERARGNAPESTRFHVYNRLLHAMAGNTDQALDPIDGLEPADRRFWRGYVYTLDRYFASAGGGRSEQRAADAVVALRDSMDALAEKADLVISEPIFCRAVNSFGNYEEFDRYEFRAGEGVVVYWESKNFGSVESAEGYRTKMQAEFEILDGLGNRRHRFEQKFKDDVCRTRRHDYFNVVVFEWPRDLTPGEYILKVTVTDLTTQKVGEKQRKLRITP